MATSKETVDFILAKLRGRGDFTARAMFGEYALYADNKVVGLICDNLSYVKIVPASSELEKICEKGNPYPGAKPHYIVDEGQLVTIQNLPAILTAVATALAAKRSVKKSARPK
jgi:TfoX/Sxy family transcriptional regulator of competence genes